MGHILWFLAGFGVATWWSKHRSIHQNSYDTSGNPRPNQSYQPWGFHDRSQTDRQWEEQRARFREMSRQAGETMVEASEATLDVLLVAVQALKDKLAEQRTMRMEHVMPQPEPQDRNPSTPL